MKMIPCVAIAAVFAKCVFNLHAVEGIIYDNGDGSNRTYIISDLGSGDVHLDNFVLKPGRSSVTKVQWWGADVIGLGWQPPTPNEFTLFIYRSPTGEAVHSIPISGENLIVNPIRSSGQYNYNEYIAEIEPLSLTPNIHYWLGIANDTTANERVFWEWQGFSYEGSSRHRSDNETRFSDTEMSFRLIGPINDPITDINLEMQAEFTDVSVWQPVNITITVSAISHNSSVSEVEDIVVSVDLPENVDISESAGRFQFSDGHFEFSIENLAVGQTFQKTLTLIPRETGAFPITASVNDSSPILENDVVTATITATNAPDLPSISVEDISIVETDTGMTEAVFPITLSGNFDPNMAEENADSGIRFQYATRDGSATSPADYSTVQGEFVFAPDQTNGSISVPVLGDRIYEPDESFEIYLLAPQNAIIEKGIATCQIINNNAGLLEADLTVTGWAEFSPTRPALPFMQTLVVENRGPGRAEQSILSATLSGPAEMRFVTSSQGTCTSDNNTMQCELGAIAPDGDVQIYIRTIPKNIGAAEYTVSVDSDLDDPNLENNQATLTTLIAGSKDFPELEFTNPGPAYEGNAGITQLAFPITLSRPADVPVEVYYDIEPFLDADASDIRIVTDGKVVINPGEIRNDLIVEILGDTRIEWDETFDIWITKIRNAYSEDSVILTGYIIDDDVDAGPLSLNPQTGLFEQTVNYVYLSDIPFSGLGLYVDISRLPQGSQVRNQSGVENGVPFLQINQSFEWGEEIEVLIEYYIPTRNVTGLPSIRAIANPISFPESREGIIVDPLPARNPLRIIDYTGISRFLIEFAATPGRVYQVQYRDSITESWKAAWPTITATGTRVQWLDDGPPKTDSNPEDIDTRFYRIVELPFE